jgi:hypothetical protein
MMSQNNEIKPVPKQEKSIFEAFQSHDVKTGIGDHLKESVKSRKMQSVENAFDSLITEDMSPQAKEDLMRRKEDFLKDEFATEVNTYADGTIDSAAFERSVNSKLDNYMTLHGLKKEQKDVSLGIFDWELKKDE